MRIKKKDLALRDKFVELGMDSKTALKVKEFYKGNMFIDMTRGIVHIGEVLEMILDMFEDIMNAGPIAKEPCNKVKVMVMDMKLHEDAIHRGPAQVYPAVRDAVKASMKQAGPAVFEPLQVHVIECPENFMGTVTKLVGSKRGQMLDMGQEGTTSQIKAKIPVAEMIGWSNDLRSATEGRGTSSILEQEFERVPASLQDDVIRKIRSRKGLSENQQQ